MVCATYTWYHAAEPTLVSPTRVDQKYSGIGSCEKISDRRTLQIIAQGRLFGAGTFDVSTEESGVARDSAVTHHDVMRVSYMLCVSMYVYVLRVERTESSVSGVPMSQWAALQAATAPDLRNTLVHRRPYK
eukprot:scaffold2375_cov361-Pinguiococcus_pyrenoidosus.AAC.1